MYVNYTSIKHIHKKPSSKTSKTFKNKIKITTIKHIHVK